MQELSIKKMLATDMKKSVRDLIEEISYVLFWGPFRALRMWIYWIIIMHFGKNHKWVDENYVKKVICRLNLLNNQQPYDELVKQQWKLHDMDLKHGKMAMLL